MGDLSTMRFLPNNMASFRQIYVFGDSASDYGSLAAALRRQTVPQGRYSGVTAHNTPDNWQILLRQRLMLPLPVDPLSGRLRLANRFVARGITNDSDGPSFAVSGATSGREHLAEFGDLRERLVAIAGLQGRGLQGQIDAALEQGLRPSSGDLTVIWGGANDLLLGVRQGRKPQKVVNRTVKRMLANVEVMLRSGEARQLVASSLVPFEGEVNGVTYQLPYISNLLRRADRGEVGPKTRAWADYFRANGSAALLNRFEQGLDELRAKYPYAALVGFRNEFEDSWRRFGGELGDFATFGIKDTRRAAQSREGFPDFSQLKIASFLHFDNVHFGQGGNRMLARALELTLRQNQGRFRQAALTTRQQGGRSADRLRGSRSNDLLIGGGGADQLWGRGGNDQLEGGNGRDLLVGATGKDVLTGGPGNDRMKGGAGADVFRWSRSDLRGRPVDVIDDFNGGEGDRLAITAVLDGNNPFANPGWRAIRSGGFSGRARELRFSGGVLRGDLNGDRRADLQVRLSGVDRVLADWIV